MTPEEILNAFATEIVLYPDIANEAKLRAIEAIKQYAREMCDKQKDECRIAWEMSPTGAREDLEIQHAPYPKELQ